MFKPILGILIVLVLSACASGFGSKLTSEKLDIYFPDKTLENYADSLGKFWTANNLVGEKKQAIQITKNGKIFEVRLIISEEFKDLKPSNEEYFLLEKLQADLQSQVFQNQDTRILVCDENFKEIAKGK